MRRRAIAAWILAAAGLGLAVAARSLPGEKAWSTIAGLLLVVAIVLGVSLLRFWRNAFPPLPPVPGLFRPVGGRERWCDHCGQPTAAAGACRTCGHLPARLAKTPTSRGKRA